MSIGKVLTFLGKARIVFGFFTHLVKQIERLKIRLKNGNGSDKRD